MKDRLTGSGNAPWTFTGIDEPRRRGSNGEGKREGGPGRVRLSRFSDWRLSGAGGALGPRTGRGGHKEFHALTLSTVPRPHENPVMPIASASPTRRLRISNAVLRTIGRSTDSTADPLRAAKAPRKWEGAPPMWSRGTDVVREPSAITGGPPRDQIGGARTVQF